MLSGSCIPIHEWELLKFRSKFGSPPGGFHACAASYWDACDTNYWPIHVISMDICMTTVKRVQHFVPKIGIICRVSVENLTSVASKRVVHM